MLRLFNTQKSYLQRKVTHIRPLTMTSLDSTNPLLTEWNDKYGLPPFADIKHSHYKDAISYAFEEHIKEVNTIATNPEEPTFDNTIAAFDRSGSLLTKILGVFYNLTSSDCPPELQKVQMEMSGPLAEHQNKIITTPGMFARIQTIYENRAAVAAEPCSMIPSVSSTVSLTDEKLRLIERIHLNFIREGAKFDAKAQGKYKEIVMKLAELTTVFAQNILADEGEYRLYIKESELDGLPDDLIESLKQIATENAGKSNGEEVTQYCCSLSRSVVEPFLTYSTNRNLRKTIWKAWCNRGQLDLEKRDNSLIINDILALRTEQARMHGYASYADFSTEDSMAKTSGAVMDLLLRVWEPAKASCLREQSAIEEHIAEHHPNDGISKGELEPWDWRYYAEKLRELKYDFDESQLKPYFSLSSMTEAIFECAFQLFGLKFIHLPDATAYHPDVKVYEVKEVDRNTGTESLRAIFLHDNYSRANKQGGAWMSEYRCQTRNFAPSAASANPTIVHNGSVVPIIVNNNNFNKAGEGKQTLLSYDDCVTLFHEFGHGLHGMLSNVHYSTLASTSVLRDFVELPSQLFEHWLSEKAVLKKYAVHYETKEPIPDELLTKLKAASSFNKGFDTVEYLSSALVDQYLHKIPDVILSTDPKYNTDTQFNVLKYEKDILQDLGMPSTMVMRHRPTHFLHLFACDSYAAAYYVYLWAEVLDADGFDAFTETGDCFNEEVAAKVRKYIYSTGNSMEPGQAFRSFRGRDPVVEPMLKKKSLL